MTITMDNKAWRECIGRLSKKSGKASIDWQRSGGRAFKFPDPTGLHVLGLDPIQLAWMVNETES